MIAVLSEDNIDVEEYEYADTDEVMKISDRLIEQHMEAYRALGNAYPVIWRL